MKQLLDAAGLRTPRHESTETVAGVWAAAERIGFPLIVKPIAGAGSADTYRADWPPSSTRSCRRCRHVAEVSVEEFVDGEEFTYDTICADGRVLFENICWYLPRPLLTQQHEWISPVTIALRELDAAGSSGGRAIGAAVLKVLGFRDGFTHMEWYRKADGEVVFGEIAARPPGARMVDVMNYATDADLFSAWAEAVTHGRISQPIERRYNAASIFKRAKGAGRITGYEGLGDLLAEYGQHVVAVDLLPGRCAEARLAGRQHLRRHGDRPPPGAVKNDRNGRTLRCRAPSVRRLMAGKDHVAQRCRRLDLRLSGIAEELGERLVVRLDRGGVGVLFGAVLAVAADAEGDGVLAPCW